MSTKELKTQVEVEDFVRGCTFFGTGGGGLPSNGIDSLMTEIAKGNHVGWVDKDEIPDDAMTVCPFLMGSIAPKTAEVLEEMKSFGLTRPVNKEKERLAKAATALAKFTKTKIHAVVPIELGGANTPGALASSVQNGILCVDGDYTGRAIPEIQQTTPYLNKKALWPVASVDEFGDVCYIESSINYLMVERIGKLIASGAYGLAGQAGFLLPGREMKQVIIPGTLTQCYEIGRMIRKARETGNDPVAAIVKQTGAWLIGGGRITKKETEDKLGYYWGTHTITGEGAYTGNTYRIWFKNENHVLWKNGSPLVTSPDIITVVNAKSGEPYANPVLVEGDEVCILGLKRRPQFDNQRAIDILGPRYFKFDFDYVPIEEHMVGR